MATAIITVDHNLNFDSIPLIDLRLLSQSELLSLSFCSSRASTATASLYDDEDEVSTPKIDRSVFNESAGSRKQTFSRLRLAPRNSSQIRPPIHSTTAGPRAEPLDEDNSKIVGLLKSLLNIQCHSSDVIDNNQQLNSVPGEYKDYLNSNVHVKLDISEGLHDVPIGVGVVTCCARKRKRGRPRKDDIRSENYWVIESYDKMSKLNESRGGSCDNIKMNVVSKTESSVNVPANVNPPAGETVKRDGGLLGKDENINKIEVNAVSDNSLRKSKRGRPRKNRNVDFKKEIVAGENDQDLAKEVVMGNGDRVVVDLVALANADDPYQEELKRRTEGMEKREELLGFLMGLKGEWVSYRKKRKIVDASEFGNALPRGWKLMLCIKKKVGNTWLGCRRYISPNGRQFVSCKEVSSYLLSLSGLRDASKQSTGNVGDCIQLDNKIPSAGNKGDCIQLDNKLTMGNAVDLPLKHDKTGANLVFPSPFPSACITAEHEKQGSLLKIKSSGEIERLENCTKQCSFLNITIDKEEKMNVVTTAAKHGVSSTISDSNNLIWQDGSSQNWSTLSGSSQQLNGGSFGSVQKQELGHRSGFHSPNAREETFHCQNLEKRPIASTLGHMKVDMENEIDESTSGSGYGYTRLEDSVTSVKEQGSFVDCSSLRSGSELKCGSLNNNRVSTSIFSEALRERRSDNGIHSSSGNDPKLVFNNNLNIISSSMLHEPKLDEVNKSWNNVLRIGFGNEQSMNKPRQPDDSEVGLLNLFGGEKISDVDNNLTKVSVRTTELPKLDEIRNSSGQTHGIKNNYKVDTGTVQESRLEDSENVRYNEFMTAFSSHSRASVDTMDELLWRADEENILLSGLTDTSSRLLQSSGYFPTFGAMSDKGASGLFNEKYDSITGIEGLTPGGSEHMEYDFLTTQSSSHSAVSKALSYDPEMPQGFDSSAWVEKEALPLLPKIGSRCQVSSVCAWCRNEFQHEPVNAGAETGSVGFMCPTCKAKFSGSHNVL